MRSLCAQEASHQLEHPWKRVPFSPAHEKLLFQSQLCSLLRFCHSFPISRSTKFPGRFLPPHSFSPSLHCYELILTFFFLLCGCSSGLSRVVGQRAGQGLLVFWGRRIAGEEISRREWSSAAIGPPTASHGGLWWHATGKITSASFSKKEKKRKKNIN